MVGVRKQGFRSELDLHSICTKKQNRNQENKKQSPQNLEINSYEPQWQLNGMALGSSETCLHVAAGKVLLWFHIHISLCRVTATAHASDMLLQAGYCHAPYSSFNCAGSQTSLREVSPLRAGYCHGSMFAIHLCRVTNVFPGSLRNGVRKNGVRNQCPYRRCGVDTAIPYRPPFWREFCLCLPVRVERTVSILNFRIGSVSSIGGLIAATLFADTISNS